MGKATARPVGTGSRVNLLPLSELARRERQRLVRAWVWAALGAIVLALLIVAGSFWLKWAADGRLVAEQQRTNQLLTEIASLSEVSRALATQSEVTAFVGDAMATDLAWGPVIAKVTSVLPADTSLTGFNLTVAGAPLTEEPEGEAGLVGVVNFDSATPLDIVPIIRSLRGVDGVLYADGQSVTSSSGDTARYAYLLNVVFDQTVYSGAFAAVEEGDN